MIVNQREGMASLLSGKRWVSQQWSRFSPNPFYSLPTLGEPPATPPPDRMAPACGSRESFCTLSRGNYQHEKKKKKYPLLAAGGRAAYMTCVRCITCDQFICPQHPLTHPHTLTLPPNIQTFTCASCSDICSIARDHIHIHIHETTFTCASCSDIARDLMQDIVTVSFLVQEGWSSSILLETSIIFSVQ